MEQQKEAPPEVRAVVQYLRSSKACIKTRVGVLNGKRVDYFKGKAAVKALLLPAYAKVKGAPKVTSEEEATALLQKIIPSAFYLRVDRGGSTGGSGSPKHLQLNQMQMFKPDDYFAWFYEGSQWTTYLGGIMMVAVILAGVMFPLWPPILRLGVWYLSMGLLGLIGLFFVIAIIRLIFYIITVVVTPPGIWIFPKLFADVGFVESFIPLWEWDLPKKKGKKKRSKEGGEQSEKTKEEAVPNGTPSEAPAARSSSRPSATVEDADDD